MSNQALEEYRPLFPKSHALLYEVYSHLMAARNEQEIAVWVSRFKALVKSLENLKVDDALSVLFIKTFHLDVENVMKRVHHELDTNKLTDEQSMLTFGIAHLAQLFGKR